MSVQVVPVGNAPDGPVVIGTGVARPTLDQLTDVDGFATAADDTPLVLRKGDDGVVRPEPLDAGDVDVDAAVQAAVGAAVGPAVDAALGPVLDEVEQALGSVTGYRHTWSQSETLVQIPHGLTYQPGGITVRDAGGSLVDPADITHPMPGITELAFGVPIGPATAWLS